MFTDILVAVDGSPTGAEGLRHAIALAAQQRARLTVLHVLDLHAAAEMASPARLREHLEALRGHGRDVLDAAGLQAARAGVEVRTVLRETELLRVAQAITAEARAGYDLVVLGTHGRRGWRRLMLGSDAETVLRTATVPVLLVRLQEVDLEA